jgi:hypothetical protein
VTGTGIVSGKNTSVLLGTRVIYSYKVDVDSDDLPMEYRLGKPVSNRGGIGDWLWLAIIQF